MQRLNKKKKKTKVKLLETQTWGNDAREVNLQVQNFVNQHKICV